MSNFNDSDSSGEFTTDKMGNTISKKALKQKNAEEEKRASAKARRVAQAKKVTAESIDKENTDDNSSKNMRPQWLQDYDRVKAKVASGKKPSGKEKKLLKRGQAREAEDVELGVTYGDVEETPLDKRLEGFSLSLSGSGSSQTKTDDNSENNDRSRDVVIKGFSISAPEKPLLVNADLTLVQGRRYGLIGANGRGKSTLLRFLAARRLPVPPTLDIQLVEQEVTA